MSIEIEEKIKNMLMSIKLHEQAAKAEGYAYGTISKRVLHAMEKILRHEFVPESAQIYAYDDTPLSIGYNQTISQPYIVALMIHMLQVKETDKILELGTGSGYNAAVLSALVKKVYTIEIVPELTEFATKNFSRLKLHNIFAKCADGFIGWPEEAPFDGIIITAAAKEISKFLIQQLKVGGRIVMPLEKELNVQKLIILEKCNDGTIKQTDIIDVRFVPLIRKN